ncbi:MAG: hypothetical protein PHQ23_15490 [Candidatus Wallbacteria bacterium]|nr:hypothetical protein [Candidatus Wallbacteria bacterium]
MLPYENNDAFTALSPQSGKSGFRRKIGVRIESVPHAMTLDEYLRLSEINLSETFEHVTLHSKANATLAGSRAIRIMFSADLGILRFKVLAYFLLRPGKAYAISFTAPEAIFASSLPEFEESAASFETAPVIIENQGTGEVSLNGRHFSHFRHGYEIDFPDLWCVFPDHQGLDASALSPVESQDDQFIENIAVRSSLLTKEISLFSFKENAVAGMSRSLPDFTVLSSSETELDGVKASRIHVSYSTGDVTAEALVLILLKNKLSLLITGVATPKSFSRYSDRFEKTFSSLRFRVPIPAEVFEPSARLKEYRNDLHGFVLGFPPDWKLHENTMGAIISALSPPESTADMFFENISVTVADFPAGMSLETYCTESLSAWQSFFNGFRELAREFITISGKEAVRLESEHSMGLIKIRGLFFVIRDGNRCFIIACAAEPDRFASFLPIFEECCAGFRILPTP